MSAESLHTSPKFAEKEENPFAQEGLQTFSGKIIEIQGRVKDLPVGWDGKRFVIQLDGIRGTNRITFYTAHADRKLFAGLRRGQWIQGTSRTSHYHDNGQDPLHRQEAHVLVSIEERSR